MNLDLENNIAKNMKNNKFIQNFTKELQIYLENKISANNNIENEGINLLNPTHNGNKIITKYRDKMLIERSYILNNFAKQTLEKGRVYYIYDKNSKMADGYNLCICEEGKSHTVIEERKENLPTGARIGSVLRLAGNSYILDEEATKYIAQEIYNMKSRLLEKQDQFLESKRIEGHIYEIYEKDSDRAWLIDVTNKATEVVEEIDFPKELLNNAKEGDLFIYKNGEYQMRNEI